MKKTFAAKSFAGWTFRSGTWTGVGVDVVIVPGPHYIVASGAFSPGAVAGYIHAAGSVEAGVHQAGTIAGSIKP